MSGAIFVGELVEDTHLENSLQDNGSRTRISFGIGNLLLLECEHTLGRAMLCRRAS
jgi:hypothetical protein